MRHVAGPHVADISTSHLTISTVMNDIGNKRGPATLSIQGCNSFFKKAWNWRGVEVRWHACYHFSLLPSLPSPSHPPAVHLDVSGVEEEHRGRRHLLLMLLLLLLLSLLLLLLLSLLLLLPLLLFLLADVSLANANIQVSHVCLHALGPHVHEGNADKATELSGRAAQL